MTGTYRILVTGSRDWVRRAAVDNALADVFLSPGLSADNVVIVHGACSTGADRLAADWADEHSVPTETHRALWERHGRQAGPIRNAQMVGAGADLCLAFIMPCDKLQCDDPRPHGTHGASGCADLAEQSGIRTVRIAA